MKVNHKLIRLILQSIGITIFIISVFFKLRSIILFGGVVKPEIDPEDEGNDTEQVLRADDDDDDDDDDDKYDEAEATEAAPHESQQRSNW